jgi:cation:H+ antiporter
VTTTDEDLHASVRPGRQQISILLAVAATAPGIVLRVASIHLTDPVDALLYGLAIIGAAFLLSWAAETAQLDISAGLAIAILAFIAVLPEYAVDLVFSVKGGHAYARFGPACQSAADLANGHESSCSLALANMTGANRLLIGIGWSMVVFVAWWQYRKRGVRMAGVTLDRAHSVELAFLSIATLYSLTIPLRRSITLLDAAILVSIFVAYTIRISKAPAEEPHLVGPARLIGGLSTSGRRTAYIALFVFAAGVILLCAEHFAASLVATGATVGISEFFLVQWLAPLASENQWTLLVGTLPVAFALASGSTHGLPIIARQREELLLTAAQSFFAIAILVNLQMSLRETWILFVLFWTQFLFGAFVPAGDHGRELVFFSAAYLALGAWFLVGNRRDAPRLLHDGFSASYSELSRSET